MTPLRPTLLTALVLSAVVLLSGCSLLPSIPGLGNGNNDSSDGSSSNDDGGSDDSLEDDLEDNPFIDQTVPETFPDEVPLPDLEILLALDLGTGWTIAYKTENAIDDFTDLADEFAGEGWEELSRASDGGQGLAIYESPEYQAQINAATEDTGYDTPIISITVVRKN